MCIRDSSLAQAKQLRELAKEGKLNGDVIDGILSEKDVYKRQQFHFTRRRSKVSDSAVPCNQSSGFNSEVSKTR